MSEWFKEPVLKTGDSSRAVGSNPTLSATFFGIGYIVLRGKCRYRRSEIDRLLADCTVAEDAATLTELKRNHTLRTGGGKPKGRRT